MMKILIWGTGKMARILIENGLRAEIVGFIQTNKTDSEFYGYPIYEPNDLPNWEYILVANTYSNQIFDYCKNNGIDTEKVIFLFNGKKTAYKSSSELDYVLGEANLIRYKAEYGIIDNTFFEYDKDLYTKLNKRRNFDINDAYLWPIITDKYAEAGMVNNYFWQDLWAAKLIIKASVKSHFDIGSRLDGFIAHLLAADIEVTMIDVREFPCEIDGLNTLVDDATFLSQIPDNSLDSLSALCSLEHFGLGRYGDPIDPEACFKCFANIQCKIKNGGHVYISVPIGRERVEFNAHRVFYPQTIVDCFNNMKLIEFSASTRDGIELNPDLHQFDNDPNNGEYRYGLFHFIKP